MLAGVSLVNLLRSGQYNPVAIVRTVRGDIDPAGLGLTSMHEHILATFEVWFEEVASSPSVPGPVDSEANVDMPLLGMLRRNPFLLRDNLRLDDAELAIAEVQAFKDAGGGCLVDVSSVGIRTDLAGIVRVAEQTGLHIVQGTGFYLEGALPTSVAGLSVDELAAAMISEVSDGIGDSGIRAGIIGEIGTMSVTPIEERILRASARAQLATGAAISLHTHPGFRHGEQIVGILTAEGVPADRIIVGHMDENLVGLGPGLAHMDYHRRLADLGVWLQYDTFGAECYYDSTGLREPLDAERASAVAIIAARGHLGQLLLGMDVWLKQSLKHYGGLGYDHLLTAVPVMLRRAGLSDADIRTMLVDNPRKVLPLTLS
jgi:phosphotriesterase-related protein